MDFWIRPPITAESVLDETVRVVRAALVRAPGPFRVTVRTRKPDTQVGARVSGPTFPEEVSRTVMATDPAGRAVRVRARHEVGEPEGVTAEVAVTAPRAAALFLGGARKAVERSPWRVGRGPSRAGGLANDLVLAATETWIHSDAFDLSWDAAGEAWELVVRAASRPETRVRRGTRELSLQVDRLTLRDGDVVILRSRDRSRERAIEFHEGEGSP